MPETVFSRPDSLRDVTTHYCPGCTHGTIHRLIAEVLDELEVAERTVGIAPVGCSVLAYNYFNTDFHEASHGRAPAVATGMKRTNPNNIIFSYQGDGDLAAIGRPGRIHVVRVALGQLLHVASSWARGPDLEAAAVPADKRDPGAIGRPTGISSLNDLPLTAAVGVHHIDLAIAVAVRDEGDQAFTTAAFRRRDIFIFLRNIGEDCCISRILL